MLGLVLILLCHKTPNQERHHVPRSQSAGEQLCTLSNRSCWWRRWRRRRRGRTQTLRWNKMEMLQCCDKVCSPADLCLLSAPTPATLQNQHHSTEPADWLIRLADSQTWDQLSTVSCSHDAKRWVFSELFLLLFIFFSVLMFSSSRPSWCFSLSLLSFFSFIRFTCWLVVFLHFLFFLFLLRRVLMFLFFVNSVFKCAT